MNTSPSTATLDTARAHARAQAGAQAATGPTVPATAARDLPNTVASDDVAWDETLGPGAYAARVLRRDTVLRITDLKGDGSVQLLVFATSPTVERLNVADTVKVQWQAYLGAGSLLLSDQGRALATIVADTSNRHDALCGGGSNRTTHDARFGDGSVSGPAPNARDLLTLAGARHGLTRADIGPWVNLFKSVRVDDDGSLRLVGDPAPAHYVELRAEMDVLVLLANCPHPLDPRSEYTATPVRLTAWRAARPEPDPWHNSTPERLRAFQNTKEALR